jgi:hypothetical protein
MQVLPLALDVAIESELLDRFHRIQRTVRS